MIEEKPDNHEILKCIICGGKPFFTGVFMPDEPENFGGIQGKQRFFRYAVCEKCYKGKAAPEKVEKIIKAEAEKRGAVYGQQ